MIALVTIALLAAAVAGVLATLLGSSYRGLVVAAVPVVLVAVAALIALAAPSAQGAGLASVRIAAVVAAMAGGSSLVTAAFTVAHAGGSRADELPNSDSSPSDTAEAAPRYDTEADAASPLRGGRAIGVLERAAIAVCIMANFPAGLAVIVAVKGLARYPELRNPDAAEQFIIGTFVSVLWACACAGVAVAVGS